MNSAFLCFRLFVTLFMLEFSFLYHCVDFEFYS
jgi:hypothetical protein